MRRLNESSFSSFSAIWTLIFGSNIEFLVIPIERTHVVINLVWCFSTGKPTGRSHYQPWLKSIKFFHFELLTTWNKVASRSDFISFFIFFQISLKNYWLFVCGWQEFWWRIFGWWSHVWDTENGIGDHFWCNSFAYLQYHMSVGDEKIVIPSNFEPVTNIFYCCHYYDINFIVTHWTIFRGSRISTTKNSYWWENLDDVSNITSSTLSDHPYQLRCHLQPKCLYCMVLYDTV